MSYHGLGVSASASVSAGAPGGSSGGGCISRAERDRFAADCAQGIMPMMTCPIGRARVCDEAAPAASASDPACVTRAQQNIAKATCLAFRLNCGYKDKPICGTPMPAIVAPTKTAISPEAAAAAQTFLRAAPRTSSGGAPVKATLTTSAASGRFAKLPVPAAAPVVTSTLPAVEPDAGIPLWVWIAGGAAVLGTGAYLYSRRKGA